MQTWKRTYYVIWLSQFLSILGFAFALPFAPYYIQELGVTDPTELKAWVSLFAASTPLALAIFSPLWGAASDRFGHRLMLLRANFSAVGVLALMGAVRNVESLIALRLLQGALTGTFTASQIMVAAHAPPERTGRALGSLSASVYCGAMFGAALGGLCSSWLGFRWVFLIAAGALFLSALLILFGTQEVPKREWSDSPDDDAPPSNTSSSRSAFWYAFPILALISFVSFGRQFDMAMMPLLVQEIHGSLDGVAMRTGLLFTISSVAGLLAGVWMGRLADRMDPVSLCIFASLGAALMMLPHALATTVWMLFPIRFAMLFFVSGTEAVTQIWLAKVTPQQHKSILFGWAGTARSIGWVLAPLSSGAVAAAFGVRAIYYVCALCFLILIPMIIWTRKRMRATSV